MKSPSLYLSLCTEFFDLDKPVAPIEEYEFYRRYVAQASGPILEPMCGTGRYLIPLLEDGYNVDGFDASPFMLDALQRKCTEKKLSPHVWEQFLENVSEEKKYNLIFIPDSSFCLFLDENHIKICLQKIYNLLEEGGTFVFDLETIHATPARIGIWQGKSYTRHDGKHLLLNTLSLPMENNIATVLCRYELIDKTEIIKTEMEYFQIKLYHPTEMITLLEEIGFKNSKQIKAYAPNCEPSYGDFTIVYECKK
jgi:SAM-dependent methyltransferase